MVRRYTSRPGAPPRTSDGATVAEDNLTPQEKQWLAALIQHGTVNRAAKALGIDQSKLNKKVNANHHLRDAWHDTVARVVEDAIASLASRADHCVEMLIASLDPSKPRLTPMEFKTIEFMLGKAEEFAMKRHMQRQLEEIQRRVESLTQYAPDHESADCDADEDDRDGEPETHSAPE